MSGYQSGDAAGVSIAALLHLVRLMGTELVAGEHRDNVELLIKSMETRLKSTQLPKELPQAAVEEGLSLTLQLLRPIFEELRQKSMRAHLRDELVSLPSSQIN